MARAGRAGRAAPQEYEFRGSEVTEKIKDFFPRPELKLGYRISLKRRARVRVTIRSEAADRVGVATRCSRLHARRGDIDRIVAQEVSRVRTLSENFPLDRW